MSKNMSEYESLRNEIISIEELQRNVWIYMYVIYATLFVLGLEFSSRYLFLTTYIVLIPFQIIINRYSWSITKMSTYIRIFYEEDEEDLNWENLHVFSGYKEYFKKFNSGIVGTIRYTGGIQLGFLATVTFIICLIRDKFENGQICLSFIDVFFMIMAICLFFLTVMLNWEYNKSYDAELEGVIGDYKNTILK